MKFEQRQDGSEPNGRWVSIVPLKFLPFVFVVVTKVNVCDHITLRSVPGYIVHPKASWWICQQNRLAYARNVWPFALPNIGPIKVGKVDFHISYPMESS